MESIKHDELKKMLHNLYAQKRPIFVWGAPAIGKSMIVAEAAKEISKKLGLEYAHDKYGKGIFSFIDMRASQMDSSDIRGIPARSGERTQWLIPNELPTEGQGILFLDEVNLSPPLVQAAFYSLIHDRKVGAYTLPEGFYVMAAGNRLEDKAHVFDMATPLKTRFMHVELKPPSVDEWIEWAVNKEIDGRVITFLHQFPQHMHRIDEESKDEAHPTPRTWEICSDMIKGQNTKESSKYIGCSVGEATRTQMIGFLKMSEKVDIDAIIKNPKNIKEHSDDISLTLSIIASLTEYFRKDKKRYMNVCLEITKYIPADISCYLLKLLKGYSGKKFDQLLKTHKEWREIIKRFSNFIIE